MSTADANGLRSTLSQLARKYPEGIAEKQLGDVDRITFHVQLVREIAGDQASVCDIGGGVGLFSAGCASVGMAVTLVDDFRDSLGQPDGPDLLQLHRDLGVHIESRDVVAEPLSLAPGSFDVITCFETMEHLHASPKKLFHNLVDCLKPNGTFILSGPNCLNLRKRIAVPLGIAQWSSMGSWYEQEVFRGHVREPSVRDLQYIFRDLQLQNVRVLGRNWHGFRSKRAAVRISAKLMDPLLRLKPSLCANIYIVGSR